MQLTRLKSSEGLEVQKIQRIEAVKLYYVYYGRNAWHSTWVTQYEKGCMHTTLKSAKSYAETKRNYGNVFYINEIAGLVYVAQDCAVIVTEINSTDPLHGFHPITTEDSSLDVWGEPDIILRTVPGCSLKTIFDAFNPLSENWIERMPGFQSILFFHINDLDILKDILVPDKCSKRHVSEAYGSDYYLGWKEIDKKYSLKGLKNVMAESALLNHKNSPLYNWCLFLASRNHRRSAVIMHADRLFDFFNCKSIDNDVLVYDQQGVLSIKDKADLDNLLSKQSLSTKYCSKINSTSYKVKKWTKGLVLVYPSSLPFGINYSSEDIWLHLRMILVRIYNLQKDLDITIVFDDGFLNRKVIRFCNNQPKEDWLNALDNMVFIFDNHSDNYENNPYLDEYYYSYSGDWELLKSYDMISGKKVSS